MFIMKSLKGQLLVKMMMFVVLVMANPSVLSAQNIKPVSIEAVRLPPATKLRKSDVLNPDSAYYKKKGTFASGGDRSKLIREAARGVGIRAGFAAEAAKINQYNMQRKRSYYERRFNFTGLLLQNNLVVPPVITKIVNVKQLPNSRYLYQAGASYEIVKEPRLITLAPTWMDYLLLPVRDVRPPAGISFENAGEKAIWRTSADEGWNEGVRQARFSFTDAWRVLKRDFDGMRFYHHMAKQGLVSVPRVDVSKIAWRVDENGRRAFANEYRVQLVAGSKFKIRK